MAILVEATGAGLTDEQVVNITGASAATYGWNTTQNPSALSCYADTGSNISGTADTIGYACRPQANSYASFQWDLALTGRPLTTVGVRGYFRYNGKNTAQHMLIMAKDASNGMQFRVDIASTGKPSLLYSGGNVWVEPTIAFTNNTVYRVDMLVISATSYRIQFFAGNSTTALIDATGTWTATLSANVIQAGVINSGTGITELQLARWAVSNSSLVGRPSGLAYANPTAAVPADSDKSVGDTFSVTGVPTLGDGASITAHEWTILEQPTGTPVYALSGTPSGVLTVFSGSATATLTGTATKAGALVLRYRAKDNTNAWSPYATTTIFVTPALGGSNKIRDRGLIGTSNWTDISTGSLGDDSDATGRKSPDNPVNEPETRLMQPVKPGALAVTIRGLKTGVAGISRSVELFMAPGGVVGTRFYQTTISPTDTVSDQVVTVDTPGLAMVNTLASLREWAVRVTSSKV